MSSENSTNQTNKLSRKQLAYQIEALGNLAFEALNMCKTHNYSSDTYGAKWRADIYRIAAGVHVFCKSIARQIVTKEAETDARYNSIAFQIEAVGESAVSSLEVNIVQLADEGGHQRAYVDGVAQSIKVFCDSIAEQLRSETNPEVE